MDPANAPAALAETHISVLVFVGDRAYKLKKPVKFGFLDFSTREKRLEACRKEVEVNRRFAPDVYLGVADVAGPDGAPCDHLVVMRRMPPDRRLAELVGQGADVDAPLRDLARLVAVGHGRAPMAPAIEATATPEAVRERWRANSADLAGFAGELFDAADLDRIDELVDRYIAGRTGLFASRLAAGRIRDGHGDLQAEDVFCLDDGPRVLDAIEFDDQLRYGDVLADVAFLAMDLERLGRPDLGARFLARYREFSGEAWPGSLAHHYIAYRAQVRAKVSSLRYRQGHAPAAEQARLLLRITLTHLEAGRVRLVLVGGLPGTGKSTLSAGLGGEGVGLVLRSDEVRKELAGLGHAESGSADFRSDLYGPAATEATYRELLRRADRALAMGESVVLDASWTAARWRTEARELARAASADVVEIRCHCDRRLADERLRRRRGDASDATPEVAVALAAVEDPWPEAVVVSTEGPPRQALEGGLEATGWGRPPPGRGRGVRTAG